MKVKMQVYTFEKSKLLAEKIISLLCHFIRGRGGCETLVPGVSKIVRPAIS